MHFPALPPTNLSPSWPCGSTLTASALASPSNRHGPESPSMTVQDGNSRFSELSVPTYHPLPKESHSESYSAASPQSGWNPPRPAELRGEIPIAHLEGQIGCRWVAPGAQLSNEAENEGATHHTRKMPQSQQCRSGKESSKNYERLVMPRAKDGVVPSGSSNRTILHTPVQSPNTLVQTWQIATPASSAPRFQGIVEHVQPAPLPSVRKHKRTFPEPPNERSTETIEHTAKRPHFLSEKQVLSDVDRVYSDTGPVGRGKGLARPSSSSKSMNKRSSAIRHNLNWRNPYPTPSPTPKKFNGTRVGAPSLSRKTQSAHRNHKSPSFWKRGPTPIYPPQWEPPGVSVETLTQPIFPQNLGIRQPDCRPILWNCKPPVWASVSFLAIPSPDNSK